MSLVMLVEGVSKCRFIVTVSRCICVFAESEAGFLSLWRDQWDEETADGHRPIIGRHSTDLFT